MNKEKLLDDKQVEQHQRQLGSGAGQSRFKDQQLNVEQAEKEVNSCLNYGRVFHDGGHTTKELELAYKQGDLQSEISHMRRVANALNKWAETLEEQERLYEQALETDKL